MPQLIPLQMTRELHAENHRRFGIITVLAALLALAGQRGAQAEPTPLRVGITPTSPPMVSKQSGQVVGIEADFAAALSEELGRPLTFVEVKWEDQIPALVEGRTDIIMSGMSITRLRQFQVAFTKPYLAVGQMALVRREDSNRYLLGFPPVLPGVVGVKKATVGDYLVQQEYPRNKRKTYATAEDAANALVKKRIDLFIADSQIVWWLAGLNEAKGLIPVPILLTQEQLAWAVRRQDSDLLSSVNEALEKLQKDGRATAIIKRWLPQLK